MPLPYINIDERCTCGHPKTVHVRGHYSCTSACECECFFPQTYPPYADLDPMEDLESWKRERESV